jgi:hypothetical protein
MTCARLSAKLVAGLALAGLLCSPSLASSQSLGAAQNFGLLGGSAVTVAGALPTTIAGDVGDTGAPASITGFPPGVVVPPFLLHVPNDGPSILAQASVTALFTSLSSAGGAATAIPAQLSGQILGPGVYSLGAADLAANGVLTLTGNGTYIFRVSSTLVGNVGSSVQLIGAQACNIWWQVGSSATLNGTTFSGNVIGFTGTNSLGPGARLDGRLLTTTPGAVTLAGSNTVNAAFCAIVPPPGAVGVSKAFGPNVNAPGAASTLTITLTNANAAPATLTTALVDTLPSGVVIAAVPQATTTCPSGVVTATAGSGSITLSAGSTIPGGAPGGCTVSANVTAAAAGVFTNTIAVGALATSNGSNVTPAIAALTIIAGIPPVPPVPTLAQWAVIALAMLLGLCGFFAIRGRRTIR